MSKCAYDKDDKYLTYKCPGCGFLHLINLDPSTGKPCWTFNGDMEKPTLSPSINSWSTKQDGTVHRRCHHFVKDGKIQFCGDSTHELKGQTVDLPDYP